MSLIRCPFCQHENNSGTRFCAECGFSLHLKICPNPQCGQISDAGAAACEHCGQSFPGIEVPIGTTNAAAPAGSRKQGGDSTTTGKERPRIAALPLIMMAIVAGGLPLLWANRALLPTPKTWQTNTPDATNAGGANPAPIVLTPPSIPANSVSTPSPVQATAPGDPVTSAPTSPPVKAATPGEVGSGGPVSNPDTTDSATKVREDQPAKHDTPKKVVKAPRVKTTEKPRPCTEATVALGLCDPKRIVK